MKKLYGIVLIIMAVITAIFGTKHFNKNFTPKTTNEFIFNIIIVIIIAIGLQLFMEDNNTDGKV
jgi:uncharacterized membrane protein YidH (DUF202 family)